MPAGAGSSSNTFTISPARRCLASAVAESHRYYPVEQVSLPRAGLDPPADGEHRRSKSTSAPCRSISCTADRDAAVDAADVRRLPAIRLGRRGARHAAARPDAMRQPLAERSIAAGILSGLSDDAVSGDARRDRTSARRRAAERQRQMRRPLPLYGTAIIHCRRSSRQRLCALFDQHRHDRGTARRCRRRSSSAARRP